jgi:hypothetical protein
VKVRRVLETMGPRIFKTFIDVDVRSELIDVGVHLRFSKEWRKLLSQSPRDGREWVIRYLTYPEAFYANSTYIPTEGFKSKFKATSLVS